MILLDESSILHGLDLLMMGFAFHDSDEIKWGLVKELVEDGTFEWASH